MMPLLTINFTIGLFYLSAISGAFVIIGSIVLIWKQKIYIDSETKKPIEFQLPLLGKFRSNTPALALFFFGTFLITYPIIKMRAPDLHLDGEITNDKDYPFEVYAAIEAERVQNHRAFSIKVPQLSGDRDEYKLLYLTDDRRFCEERVPVKNSKSERIPLQTKAVPRNQVVLEQGKVGDKPAGY